MVSSSSSNQKAISGSLWGIIDFVFFSVFSNILVLPYIYFQKKFVFAALAHPQLKTWVPVILNQKFRAKPKFRMLPSPVTDSSVSKCRT
jgi:hypothetical protein